MPNEKKIFISYLLLIGTLLCISSIRNQEGGKLRKHFIALNLSDFSNNEVKKSFTTFKQKSKNGTIYYVDTSKKANDNNDGKSAERPWRTLKKINSAILKPGDAVLFKSGSVWNGHLSITQSGEKNNPITIDKYGGKKKPLINGGGLLTNSAATILIKNSQYIEINNLELTNTNGDETDQGSLWGILGILDKGGIAHHIYIRNCKISDVNDLMVGNKKTGGIYITAGGDEPGWYDDLKIENNHIENVGGLGIATQSPHGKFSNETRYPFLNVLIKGNTVNRTGRNNIIIRVSDDAIVEHNTLINSSRKKNGHSIFCFDTDNVQIQYNEAYGNVGEGDRDRGGFDADYNCKNTKIQYNFSHDNYWGYAIMRRGINENIVIRYNISQNDQNSIYHYGFSGKGASNSEDFGMNRALVYNNTHFVKSGLDVTVFGSGDFESEAYNTDFFNNIYYFEDSGAEWGLTKDVNFENNSFYNIKPRGKNYIIENPKLKNPSKPIVDIDWKNYPNVLTGFHLKPSSPCIDRGKRIENNGKKDFWGNPLYVNEPDIGAHEYQKK